MVRYMNNTTKPFLFITGDERFYDKVEKVHVEQWIHPWESKADSVPSDEIFKEARKKYEIFYLQKGNTKHATQAWENAIGAERILRLQDPKAVVDVMLGAIALVSGSRNMERYLEDLHERGQDPKRCDEVLGALTELSLSLKYKEAMKEAAPEARAMDEKERVPPMPVEGADPDIAEALTADLERVDSAKSEDLVAELAAARKELELLRAAEKEKAKAMAPAPAARKVYSSS
jgi:hypothetical protein